MSAHCHVCLVVSCNFLWPLHPPWCIKLPVANHFQKRFRIHDARAAPRSVNKKRSLKSRSHHFSAAYFAAGALPPRQELFLPPLVLPGYPLMTRGGFWPTTSHVRCTACIPGPYHVYVRDWQVTFLPIFHWYFISFGLQILPISSANHTSAQFCLPSQFASCGTVGVWLKGTCIKSEKRHNKATVRV